MKSNDTINFGNRAHSIYLFSHLFYSAQMIRNLIDLFAFYKMNKQVNDDK